MITNEYDGIHLQNQLSNKYFEADKADTYFTNQIQIEDFLKTANNNMDNQQSTDLDSSLDNISNWEDFNESLYNYLDMFNYRDASCLIREFIKLEEYLNCEYKVTEREKEIEFASQEKLREYLNKNLNEKYFRLSQSTSLFEDLRLKLTNLFKKNLGIENLKDVLTKFNQVQSNYENLFDKVKSKVKLRKSKYEMYLQIWREFDTNSKNLETLFKLNTPEPTSNLEYRTVILEMNTYLNKLKEELGTLTSICCENKYFELKNQIIIYELKLKKFKETCESKEIFQTKTAFVQDEEIEEDMDTLAKNDVVLKLNVPSSNKNNKTTDDPNFNLNRVEDEENKNFQTSIRIINNNHGGDYAQYEKSKSTLPKFYLHNKSPVSTMRYQQRSNLFYKNASPYSDYENHDFFDNNNYSPYPNRMKKIETSDKSTATINEVSTQTDNITNSGNSENICLSGATNEKPQITKLANSYFNIDNRSYLKKSKLTKHSSRESDGKKMLLEAYLRNNENLTNGSTTSSGKAISSNLSILNSKKNGQNKQHIPKNTRESGIGTTNDDEVDSLQSVQDFLCDVKSADKNEDLNDNSDKENESFYDLSLKLPSENNTDDLDDFYSNCLKKEKQVKKKTRQRSQNKVLMAKSQDDESFNENLIQAGLAHKRNLNVLNDNNQISIKDVFKEDDPIIKPDQNPSSFENEETPSSNLNLAFYLSRLLMLLIYIFPLGILFCLIFYYFFLYYLNPTCCDQKRNYLVWNII